MLTNIVAILFLEKFWNVPQINLGQHGSNDMVHHIIIFMIIGVHRIHELVKIVTKTCTVTIVINVSRLNASVSSLMLSTLHPNPAINLKQLKLLFIRPHCILLVLKDSIGDAQLRHCVIRWTVVSWWIFCSYISLAMHFKLKDITCPHNFRNEMFHPFVTYSYALFSFW